ncbi:hypothetical protein [Williamsia sp.]|uniref:hypothetical protein n=1 Tax=Williamsia sp. TaxID=1872085 RepID=UPI001A2D4677|nr:hypothetical protein [Williamsia sp.]MBJ7287988.1 hypothetical protein [Williamsia sp.]
MSEPEFWELDPKERVIVNEVEDDELLWRQICDHSWDAQYGLPNLDSFGPQKVDQRRPSFSRSSVVTAQESRDWQSEWAKSKSRGVWACSIQEVADAGTRAIDDSETALEPGKQRAPGHAYVDYRHMGKAGLKAVKARLLKAALARKEIPTDDNFED